MTMNTMEFLELELPYSFNAIQMAKLPDELEKNLLNLIMGVQDELYPTWRSKKVRTTIRAMESIPDNEKDTEKAEKILAADFNDYGFIIGEDPYCYNFGLYLSSLVDNIPKTFDISFLMDDKGEDITNIDTNASLIHPMDALAHFYIQQPHPKADLDVHTLVETGVPILQLMYLLNTRYEDRLSYTAVDEVFPEFYNQVYLSYGYGSKGILKHLSFSCALLNGFISIHNGTTFKWEGIHDLKHSIFQPISAENSLTGDPIQGRYIIRMSDISGSVYQKLKALAFFLAYYMFPNYYQKLYIPDNWKKAFEYNAINMKELNAIQHLCCMEKEQFLDLSPFKHRCSAVNCGINLPPT